MKVAKNDKVKLQNYIKRRFIDKNKNKDNKDNENE